MTVVRDKQVDKEPQTGRSENALTRMWRESRAEIRKIVWPTREETTRLTIVVVLLSALISVLLFAADSVFALLLTLLQRAVSGS